MPVFDYSLIQLYISLTSGDITSKGFEKKRQRLLTPYVNQAGASGWHFFPYSVFLRPIFLLPSTNHTTLQLCKSLRTTNCVFYPRFDFSKVGKQPRLSYFSITVRCCFSTHNSFMVLSICIFSVNYA